MKVIITYSDGTKETVNVVATTTPTAHKLAKKLGDKSGKRVIRTTVKKWSDDIIY